MIWSLPKRWRLTRQSTNTRDPVLIYISSVRRFKLLRKDRLNKCNKRGLFCFRHQVMQDQQFQQRSLDVNTCSSFKNSRYILHRGPGTCAWMRLVIRMGKTVFFFNLWITWKNWTLFSWNSDDNRFKRACSLAGWRSSSKNAASFKSSSFVGCKKPPL